MSVKTLFSAESSYCMENIAIHEFGHVIGLRHEMNRRDQDDCWLDQTAGYGEYDAIQIGDYDPKSVMNYCWLEKKNAKNQRINLSKGDRLILTEMRAGRLASFEKVIPLVESASNIALEVVGPELQGYRYHATLEQEANCKHEEAYSQIPRPLSEPIVADDFSELPVGYRLKLCVRGLHQDGQWQASEAYSSMVFAIKHPTDQMAPALTSIELYSAKIDSGADFTLSFTAIDDSQVF